MSQPLAPSEWKKAYMGKVIWIPSLLTVILNILASVLASDEKRSKIKSCDKHASFWWQPQGKRKINQKDNNIKVCGVKSYL